MDEGAGRQRPPARPTYASAGVDLAGADAAVERIKTLALTSSRPEVRAAVGGFAGLFELGRYRRPVLAASTDGVGTKAMVARALGDLSTLGIDLVAMCADDLVCQGAEPLFFLDYLSVGHLDPDMVSELVAGMAEGCRVAGCALIGGETAEHPGQMEPGAFDMAGFAVGVVEADRVLGPARVRPGDALVGLVSPGLRCNGYSLARKALLEVAGLSLESPSWPGSPRSLGEALLEPSVIYCRAVLAVAASQDLHAAAHVTGGGLASNLARILPDGCDAVVDRATWSVPRLFSVIEEAGRVDPEEMERVFNLGVGMVLVLPPASAEAAGALLGGHGVESAVIGEIVAGEGAVRLQGDRSV